MNGLFRHSAFVKSYGVKWMALLSFCLAGFAMRADFPKSHPPQKGLRAGESASRTFIINACISNMGDFAKLVRQAAKLKPYGRVQINISTLAEKDFASMPRINSPWHEYAAYNPTPYKFFPAPEIRPFIDAAFVKKNRDLLMEKAKMLKENDMDAAFFGYEPNYLPAAFFDAHPDMMGPRVDHPRRSNQKEFSPCVSVVATQRMYAGMIEQLLRNAPEIKSFYFKTNDAGTGICWADWLYSGPNGPDVCKGQTTGERVAMLMNAFKKGAAQAGRPLDIYLSEGSSNFSDSEKLDIQRRLPDHCYYKNTEAREMSYLGTVVTNSYPVKDIIDPLAYLRDLSELSDRTDQSVFINLRVWYERGNDTEEGASILFSMIADHLRNHAEKKNELQQLRDLCEAWGGKGSAEDLFNAFQSLHEAFRYKAKALPGINALNWDVALRLINRPLLIAPQRLSHKEERYFLPYVFNVAEQEARMDYTDVQGGRVIVSRDSLRIFTARILSAVRLLEQVDASAPQQAYIRKLALALRVYSSLMRSCGNFAGAQLIRDNNAEKLADAIHRPDKKGTWTGAPDFIEFVDLMRDELDNTQELDSLLQNGGLALMYLSKDIRHEDTFLLGPGLAMQVKEKRKIMLDHWLDIQDYLHSPFK